ncbi:MAG: hypothetical protein ACK5LO_13615 [Leucobacter sp.]
MRIPLPRSGFVWLVLFGLFFVLYGLVGYLIRLAVDAIILGAEVVWAMQPFTLHILQELIALYGPVLMDRGLL